LAIITNTDTAQTSWCQWCGGASRWWQGHWGGSKVKLESWQIMEFIMKYNKQCC